MKYMRMIFLALMIICMIYSVSIYMVGSGTFSFVIWIVGAAFFGISFFLAGNGRWLKVPIALRALSYGLIALVLVALIICSVAMASHFGDKGEKDLDYIIVLGAQMRDYGPSIIFKYRLDAAYEYLSENPDTICIVSGGQGANESVSEGDGGKEYLVSRGIAPDRIIAETKAEDTNENIMYSLDIMRQAAGSDEQLKIGIVTNNFHVFRGVHLAKKLTDDDVCGIAANTVPWYLPNNMVRECFGILRDLRKMRM
jgi:uncharacterized SAM-binding protein YcdF (DUF218 family)